MLIIMRISARMLRRYHAGMTMLWVLLSIPSILFWKNSIAWVIVMSVYANIAASFAAWQAARIEDDAPSA